jgi:hypothetical protein
MIQGWVRGLEPPTFRSTGEQKPDAESPKSSGFSVLYALPTGFASACERFLYLREFSEIPRIMETCAEEARKTVGSFNGLSVCS